MRSHLTALIVSGVLVASACSNSDTGRHAGHTPGSSEPRASTSPAPSPTRTVAVTMRDTMRYEPERLDVKVGDVVEFVVTNAGTIRHEFYLAPAETQQAHEQEMAGGEHGQEQARPKPLVHLSVEPGKTGRAVRRFEEVTALEYACHEPGHYAAGMRAHLIVAPLTPNH